MVTIMAKINKNVVRINGSIKYYPECYPENASNASLLVTRNNFFRNQKSRLHVAIVHPLVISALEIEEESPAWLLMDLIGTNGYAMVVRSKRGAASIIAINLVVQHRRQQKDPFLIQVYISACNHRSKNQRRAIVKINPDSLDRPPEIALRE